MSMMIKKGIKKKKKKTNPWKNWTKNNPSVVWYFLTEFHIILYFVFVLRFVFFPNLFSVCPALSRSRNWILLVGWMPHSCVEVQPWLHKQSSTSHINVSKVNPHVWFAHMYRWTRTSLLLCQPAGSMGQETFYTIEVAHFRWTVFWLAAFLNTKPSECQSFFAKSCFCTLGPWDSSSGRNLIFAENGFRVKYGARQVTSLGTFWVNLYQSQNPSQIEE